VWGSGGWLAKLGVLDFAGGLVVHATSGMAALAAELVIGTRRGFGHASFMPHNLPMTMLGTGLLWFGWFGFNGGSALAANETAATAFVATHLGGMAGMAMWTAVEWVRLGRPTTLPAAGFVGPNAAIVIGLVAGAVCCLAVNLKGRLKLDDSLDVVGIHGVGGVVGSLLLGVFATRAVNPAGVDGLLAGGGLGPLLVQAMGVLVVCVYAFAVSWLILKLTDRMLGLRVSEEDELLGLDRSEHTETAYN
jgi:Amt family ammonium transporter